MGVGPRSFDFGFRAYLQALNVEPEVCVCVCASSVSMIAQEN